MLGQSEFDRNTRRVLSNVITSSQWIVVLFVWALCVQILVNALVVGFDASLFGDELDYNSYAINLVTQHQYISGAGNPYWPQDMSRRPPAFPLYLALVYGVFGLENYTAVKIGQSIIGALLCVVLFILAQRSFDTRTGLLSGFMASVYPYLVCFSVQLRPELLYLLCAYSGAVFFLQFIGTRRLVFGIMAGICWGIAALTRSDWLLTMPLFFIWGLLSLGKKRQDFLRLLAVFVATLIIILPWAWRNYLVHDSFIPTNTNLGVTIAGTNNPATVQDPILRGEWLPPEDILQFTGDLSGLSEVERDRAQVKYALTFIRQNPMDFLILGVWRLVRHWHFHYPLTYNSLLGLATLVFYFILLFLAILGIIRLLILRRIPGFIYFTFILFLFTNVIAFSIRGGTRYRLLIDPSLIILASYMVLSISDTLFKRLKTRGSSQ